MENEKIALRVEDVAKRYGVSRGKAYSIMRVIKGMRGDNLALLALGREIVLLSELEYFEKSRGGADSGRVTSG